MANEPKEKIARLEGTDACAQLYALLADDFAKKVEHEETVLSTEEVLLELLEHAPANQLSNKQIQKLIYFAAILCDKLTHKKVRLFENDFGAWEHGPVQRSVFIFVRRCLEMVKRKTHEVIDLSICKEFLKARPSLKPPRPFPKVCREIIQVVVAHFGGLSGDQLEGLSHLDSSAWSAVYVDGEKKPIPSDLALKTFDEPWNCTRFAVGPFFLEKKGWEAVSSDSRLKVLDKALALFWEQPSLLNVLDKDFAPEWRMKQCVLWPGQLHVRSMVAAYGVETELGGFSEFYDPFHFHMHGDTEKDLRTLAKLTRLGDRTACWHLNTALGIEQADPDPKELASLDGLSLAGFAAGGLLYSALLEEDALNTWRSCRHPLAQVAHALAERSTESLKQLGPDAASDAKRALAVLTNDWRVLGDMNLHYDAGRAALHGEQKDEALKQFSIGAKEGDERCFSALLSIDESVSQDEVQLTEFAGLQGAYVALGNLFERKGELKTSADWYRRADILNGGPHLVRIGELTEEEYEDRVQELKDILSECDYEVCS